MEVLGPCDGQSESTKECHGMDIRAMHISMEELGPWDGPSESPDQCHGMAMGGCQWKGPWNSLVHVVANQKGAWQCHGMAMGLSKEGPNGRGWPIGIAIQKGPGKAMAWPCVWEGGNASPMEEPGPCDGQSESTQECHGMDIRAMSISMEE